MKVLALIPARYASSRFPGKPLVDILGKPMIQRVYERTSEAFSDVYVATDDERIVACVDSFSGRSVMTSSDHRSGTDRCYEAACRISERTGEKFDIIVNVQGDEPFIEPGQLKDLVACFSDDSVQIATLVKRIDSAEELFDPNTPKVVKDCFNNALYFSRSPIPYCRAAEDEEWLHKSRSVYFKHIGLYAYRMEVLEKITAMPCSPLEETEKLEQLRWLEAGLKIAVAESDYEGYSVDIPDDIRKIEAHFGK